jgi:acetylornithine/succinyldiaminopimelate/putrescine aminotransferase
MTLAKGLGGGIPIGAILAKERASVFEPGDHGSTFGGNPVACAAACATLKFIAENDIPTNAAQVGDYFIGRLQALKSKFESIAEVRGQGLLIALGFNEAIADKVLEACLQRGLLTNQVRPDALRFMPPLTVSRDEIDQAVDILEDALLEVSKELSE